MFEAVHGLLPEATGYQVNFPASFELGSRDLGAADVVKYVTQKSAKCSRTKFALIGYSQGGDVMHVAAKGLNPSLFPSIVAITLFGDPGNRGPNVKSPLGGMVSEFPLGLDNKIRQNCEKGDRVCTNSGTIVGSHLEYSSPGKDYIKLSAQYIADQFKTDGKVGPQPSPNGGVKDVGNNSAALRELAELLGGSKDQLSALSST
jgi:hypothetical protein